AVERLPHAGPAPGLVVPGLRPPGRRIRPGPATLAAGPGGRTGPTGRRAGRLSAAPRARAPPGAPARPARNRRQLRISRLSTGVARNIRMPAARPIHIMLVNTSA